MLYYCHYINYVASYNILTNQAYDHRKNPTNTISLTESNQILSYIFLHTVYCSGNNTPWECYRDKRKMFGVQAANGFIRTGEKFLTSPVREVQACAPNIQVLSCINYDRQSI